MAQNSFALMTNLGRAKEAAAIANGTAVVITHIAIGDGTTVPSGGETSLYHEIARKTVSGHGTVTGAANVAYFDIFLAASEGPYTIREAGLIDQAGDLIAIARYDPPINKPIPSSGQTVEGTVRLEVAFSNIANVTIVVDPTFQVPMQRLSRLPWLPVLSMSNAMPPTTPVIGDVYLVPAGATGAWTGQAGKIAEYTAAGWGIITPPDGHGVSLPDGRVFERVGGTYIEKLALDAQSGKWNYVAATGSANAITASIVPVPSVLTAGLKICLRMASANTGATTINLNGLGAKAVLYNEVGTALIGGDWPAGSIVDFVYDGTSWRMDKSLGFLDGRYARLTTPPSNIFYVVGSVGNDNNTGLANTAAEGFATIQGAINAISSRYITTGTVTVNIANGTYDGVTVPASFVSSWRFIGNVTSPASVAIRAIATEVNTGRALVNYGNKIILTGVQMQSVYENINNLNGTMTVTTVNVILPTDTSRGAISTYGGNISIDGTIRISGSGMTFLNASQGGSILLGYSDSSGGISVTFIYSGASFTRGNVMATANGSVLFSPSITTFQGTATGPRYAAFTNGIIDTGGSGVNYIPGSSAGSTSTGGQYI